MSFPDANVNAQGMLRGAPWNGDPKAIAGAIDPDAGDGITGTAIWGTLAPGITIGIVAILSDWITADLSVVADPLRYTCFMVKTAGRGQIPMCLVLLC